MTQVAETTTAAIETKIDRTEEIAAIIEKGGTKVHMINELITLGLSRPEIMEAMNDAKQYVYYGQVQTEWTKRFGYSQKRRAHNAKHDGILKIKTPEEKAAEKAKREEAARLKFEQKAEAKKKREDERAEKKAKKEKLAQDMKDAAAKKKAEREAKKKEIEDGRAAERELKKSQKKQKTENLSEVTESEKKWAEKKAAKVLKIDTKPAPKPAAKKTKKVA